MNPQVNGFQPRPHFVWRVAQRPKAVVPARAPLLLQHPGPPPAVLLPSVPGHGDPLRGRFGRGGSCLGWQQQCPDRVCVSVPSVSHCPASLLRRDSHDVRFWSVSLCRVQPQAGTSSPSAVRGQRGAYGPQGSSGKLRARGGVQQDPRTRRLAQPPQPPPCPAATVPEWPLQEAPVPQAALASVGRGRACPRFAGLPFPAVSGSESPSAQNGAVPP